MKNPRLTKKEKGLLKGAIRRVFSRSELRRKALELSLVKDYADPKRPRVTKWGRCTKCNKMEPAYLLEVDHEEPVVPVDGSFEDMSIDELVDRIWCDERLLKPMCKPCHKLKSKEENKERRRLKKEKSK